MPKQTEKRDSYYIPPNFIDTGTIWGGMFKLRNVIEAGVLVGVIVLPLFQVNLSLKIKIILACITALPLGLLALIGVNGESLTTFICLPRTRYGRRIPAEAEEGLSMTAAKKNPNNLNDIFWGQQTTEKPYDELLEEVRKYISDNHAKDVSAGGSDAPELIRNLLKQYLIRQKYTVVGYDIDTLSERLYEDMAGYSFLRKWIYQDGVEEVNINAYNDIEVILSGGKSMKIPEKFATPTQAIDEKNEP